MGATAGVELGTNADVVMLPSQPRVLRPAVYESDDLAGWSQAWIEPTSPGPYARLLLASPGPYVRLLLTSRGPSSLSGRRVAGLMQRIAKQQQFIETRLGGM